MGGHTKTFFKNAAVIQQESLEFHPWNHGFFDLIKGQISRQNDPGDSQFLEEGRRSWIGAGSET